ncbi:MAG: aminotransferase class I/II-fold pyridoxal phosphate-dependent enzyme [Phycisphaerae bacterium]|jgi:O-acetylhomoserine (thiol)-lyase|nr:aminotransferase class I/II-fold pyridoxal phosphate-dependent enzyme [Phycisphaerae bacterium]MDP7286750.1 aminotransferase class I/II-fold pyridoxal phosphate-dependent enzyme [Phycisphaerae bacterium]
MKSETLAIHGGFSGDGVTGATAAPIYQTVSYAHRTAQELADVFGGISPGYIYTRIANPTTTALEARLAELEDGIGAIATSSGMAAIASVVMGLVRAGDEIVAAAGIFGGTVSLFEKTLGRFGVESVLVDAAETTNFAAAINTRTKLVFVETIGNPRMDVPDIPGIAAVAHKAGIPLIVDNTLATPVLIKPGEHGADIVVHSTSKFINGHGTAIGGAIIDTGNYDWKNGAFEDIKQLSQQAGNMAFLEHLRNLIYRDLGGCPAPMNSFLMLQGLETLPGRMDKHCQNALKLAEFLSEHPNVSWVNYPALKGNAFRGRVNKLFGGRGGGLLTFGLGDKGAAYECIDSLKLAKNLANLGDVKTLVIHPASTIFHEFSIAEQNKMGVTEDMVRVSVGIENFEDIEADFRQAIAMAIKEKK